MSSGPSTPPLSSTLGVDGLAALGGAGGDAGVAAGAFAGGSFAVRSRAAEASGDAGRMIAAAKRRWRAGTQDGDRRPLLRQIRTGSVTQRHGRPADRAVVEIAAYTSAWFVRHPDGALSAEFARAEERERAGRRTGRALEVSGVAGVEGKKVVAEGPQ
jgi:hypothetical protein